MAPTAYGSHAVASRLLAAQCLMAAVGLFVNVAAARSMGPEGRGSLAIFLQVSYLATTVCVAGTNRSYPAALEQRPRLGTALLDQAQLLVLPVAVAVALCLLLPFTPAGGDGSAPTLYGLALATLVVGLVLATAVRTAAVASGTARTYLRIVAGGQAALVLTSVAFLIAGVESPAAWLGAYAIAHTGPPLAAWLLGRGRAKPSPSRPEVVRTARRVGLRLLPSTLANITMLRIDRLILPALAGTGQLGLYVVVAAVTELIAWPLASYVDSRIPHWRAAVLTGSLRPGKLLGVATTYAVAAVAVVIVTTRWLLVPVFGTEYRDAIPLIAPLALAAGAYSLSRVGHGLAVAARRARWVTAIDVVGMVVAVAAYLLLIPPLGATGAAVGSLLGYSASLVVSLLVVAAFRDPRPVRTPR